MNDTPATDMVTAMTVETLQNLYDDVTDDGEFDGALHAVTLGQLLSQATVEGLAVENEWGNDVSGKLGTYLRNAAGLIVTVIEVELGNQPGLAYQMILGHHLQWVRP